MKIRKYENFKLDNKLWGKLKNLANNIEANEELKKKYDGKPLDKTDEGKAIKREVLGHLDGKNQSICKICYCWTCWECQKIALECYQRRLTLDNNKHNLRRN